MLNINKKSFAEFLIDNNIDIIEVHKTFIYDNTTIQKKTIFKKNYLDIYTFNNDKFLEITMKDYFFTDDFINFKQVFTLSSLTIDLFDQNSKKTTLNKATNTEIIINRELNSFVISLTQEFFHIIIESDINGVSFDLFYNIDLLTDDFSKFMTNSDTLNGLYNNMLEDLNYNIKKSLEIENNIILNNNHIQLLTMLKI